VQKEGANGEGEGEALDEGICEAGDEDSGGEEVRAGFGLDVTLGVGVAVTCDDVSSNSSYPQLDCHIQSDGSQYTGRRCTQRFELATQTSRTWLPSPDRPRATWC
jgi:hypothetical protein